MDTNLDRPWHRAVFAVAAILMAAALLLSSYGVTAAKRTTTTTNKAVASAADAGATTASRAASEETATSPTEPDRVRKAPDPRSEPRECDLASGVSSACVFE
jgi:hypothetical protein